MGETPYLEEMQRQYEQMRAEMLEMKQANERLATDFTTSQERIQKLQVGLLSCKTKHVNWPGGLFEERPSDT